MSAVRAPETERPPEPARERPAAPRERDDVLAGPALAPGDLRLAGGAPPPAGGGGAASVLRLQRAVGNARVQRALAAPGGAAQRQAEAPAAETTEYDLLLGIPGREPERHRTRIREEALEALRGFRRQVLGLVEGGREGHRYMVRLREEQYVVGFVSDVLGRVSLPGMEIWQAPLSALALADAALAEGDVTAGARLLKTAAAGWREAQDQVAAYTEGTVTGAGRAEVVLEVTAVVGGVAASLVTGGAVSGLLVGTAYAATQTAARQASELSLGLRDRIDWAGVTFDALFSLVTSKLGGKLGEGILKRLLARPEVASLGRRALTEAVSELLSGQAIASLHMAARTVFDNLRGAGAPVTVEQFIDQLGAHLTDPKSMFFDLLLGHVQRKLAVRAEASRAARDGRSTPPPPEMEAAAAAPRPLDAEAPAARTGDGPEPAARTMAGSESAPRPRAAGGGGAEADPVHEMMAREGIRRGVAEPGTGPGLRPHSDYARDVRDPAEAYALYDRALGESNGQEVAIFRSERDGTYSVRVGDHGSVRSPAGEGWTAVLHFHPNRTAAERFFLPAPADFQDISARRGDGGRTVREFIEFHVPGVGRGRAEYGADPSGDRPFYVTTHAPDGTPHTVRFRDVDEFRGYWESHHVAAAPGSELHAALVADVEAYLAGTRRDPAEGERTMAGSARGGGSGPRAGAAPSVPDLNRNQRARIREIEDEMHEHRMSWEDLRLPDLDAMGRHFAAHPDPDTAIRALERRFRKELGVRKLFAEEQRPEQWASRSETTGAGRSVEKGPEVPEGQRLPRPTDTPSTEIGGIWSGVRGDSEWSSDIPAVIAVTGGKPVRFRNGYPDFSPWARERAYLRVTGHDDTDFAVADRLMARLRGFPNQTAYAEWRSANRLTWHHVEGAQMMILVPRDLHENVPHVGGASEARGGH